MTALVALLSSAVLAATPVQYLASQQRADGSFSEPGGQPGPALTAWAVLGLRAAGAFVPPVTLRYLVEHEDELEAATDLELAAMAELALGGRGESLLARIRALEQRSGAIGPTLNSTIWGVLALRSAGAAVSTRTVAYLLSKQARNGGWSWAAGAGPDSNDTAAAVQALAASGVTGRPLRRALQFLRSLRNADGGFELSEGRGSDAQSTAWALQAFQAAGVRTPAGAAAYLARLRRADGSVRYSTRYGVTPVWVTAQVLPALARRSFPLG